MANTKISALPADAAPTTDDLLVIVNDPGGSPVNKRTTIGDVLALVTSTGTVTNTGTLTDHQIVVANGGVDVSTLGSLGSSGDVLTSQGAAADPQWATPSSGKVVQVVNTEITTAANGTTVIPYDNTKPQNTEGNEYMTLAITPTSATNTLKIEVVLQCTLSAAGNFAILALFQDAAADAIATCAALNATATGGVILVITHVMTAGTTSATTFKVRAGPNASGTFYFNSHPSFTTGIFGGVSASSITITEIVP